jgi:hypothetical protein
MKTTFSSLSALAVLLLLALLNGGCATGPKVDPQVTAAVAAGHVNQGTYDKVFNGRTLDFGDIQALVQGRVPSHIIVGYLRSTQQTYDFTDDQLGELRNAGAKPHLLNYLTETRGFYSKAVQSGGKIPKYVRDNSKLNQDKQPFFYNAPVVDDWYDSAYTESSYSPFSFN